MADVSGAGMVQQIKPRDLATHIANDRTILLLDVRQPWEHDMAAIAGSTLIPLSELPARASEIKPPADAWWWFIAITACAAFRGGYAPAAGLAECVLPCRRHRRLVLRSRSRRAPLLTVAYVAASFQLAGCNIVGQVFNLPSASRQVENLPPLVGQESVFCPLLGHICVPSAFRLEEFS